MVRKLLTALLIAALMIPCAAMADVQVIDDAGIIDPNLEMQITEVIETVEKNHQVDLAVLVTYDVPDDYSDSLYRVRDYADDYYDNGGFGMGDDFSGMLYLIDLNNRVQWISTGGVMIEYINDYREELILNAAEPYLMDSHWGSAALAAMKKTSEFMDQGRMKGTFLYDEMTGKRLSGIYNPLEPAEILLGAIAGVAAAAAIVAVISGRYSLKGNTYSYNLDGNSEADMYVDEETFIRESVSHVPRVKVDVSSSGGSRSGSRGSGVHRSSSGRSHGGGGRRF